MDYVELHCHTNFSFLDGASHPEDIVARAGELGLRAIAVTDHSGLYGVVKMARACRAAGIKPIVGVEMTVWDGFHLVLLAKNNVGYSNLSRLISHAHLAGPDTSQSGQRIGAGPDTSQSRQRIGASGKGKAALDYATLVQNCSDIICLSGCRRGEIASHLLAGRRDEALRSAKKYLAIFGRENFRIELQNHLLPEDRRLCAELAGLARKIGVDCVATNNVHYATPENRRLQDILVCIKTLTTLDQRSSKEGLRPSPEGLRRLNAEFYLKSPGEMYELFQGYPEAVRNTLAVAEQCEVDLGFGSYRFPKFTVPPIRYQEDNVSGQAPIRRQEDNVSGPAPIRRQESNVSGQEGETPFSYLYQLVHEGTRERYHPITATVLKQIAHELDVIQKLGLEEYFLIVWDIARFCREQGILAQGRGSAANSVVCYCLGITAVDPIKLDLLFERFLSEERAGTPDIDLDVANKDREKVIQYLYEKYGREHAGMVCEVITYRERSAIRDVGKALGLSPAQVDALAKGTDRHWGSREGRDVAPVVPFTASALTDQLFDFCKAIQDFPRHLGIHVGGMIVTAKPLVEVIPVERATMEGRTVVQWDKDDVEDVGLVKIDVLGLGMLSLIGDCLKLVERHRGVKIDLARLSYDDPAVYDMLCEADTVGVFQVESRAQMATLPRLKPRCFYDLVVEVAIIRPGPIQGEMVHPYLRRRQGLEKITYPHPKLEPVLKKTLGVPLFQEQGMKLAIVAAGFSPGKADLLRKAMGSKRSRKQMEALYDDLIQGMVANGISGDLAVRIFKQLAAFADYGFPESHAASFALIVYASAYLKRYFPAEFYCALLNNQPMGFYQPSVIVGDARRHEIEILPVDANESRADCTVEGDRVRLGYRYVRGVGETAFDRLDEEAAKGPYRSLADFCRRTQLDRGALENLIMVGAFDRFGVPRRKILWDLPKALRSAREGEFSLDSPADETDLPEISVQEAAALDYRVLGLSPSKHVMEFFRHKLKGTKTMRACELASFSKGRNGDWVRLAGVVVCRQRPGTAKGFIFITLEDETGLANIIVNPRVVEKYRLIVRGEPLIMVEGILQNDSGVINVLAQHFVPLSSSDAVRGPRSRDFH